MESKLKKLIREWSRDAVRHRAAQAECEPREDEWWLHKEAADMLTDHILKIAEALAHANHLPVHKA